MTDLSLRLVPIGLDEARRFVGQHHRHNLPPQGWKFGVGLMQVSESPGSTNLNLVGVGIAGRPVGRKMCDGTTIELTRVCTLGTRNANSMIYGALCRAAKALGYRRAITYTLAAESGSSLRAVGFVLDAELPPSRGWDQPSRQRFERDLFGDTRTPEGPKLRWIKEWAA